MCPQEEAAAAELNVDLVARVMMCCGHWCRNTTHPQTRRRRLLLL